MPVFPLEFMQKSTIHQRQLIEVEADTIEEAIATLESYAIDTSDAIDLGSPNFTEWLIDDVKAHDPDNSPLTISPALLNGSNRNQQAKIQILAQNIIFVTDGADVELPTEMTIEIEPGTPEDQYENFVTSAISDQLGWLVESLSISELASVSEG